jgi:hypothetical protein
MSDMYFIEVVLKCKWLSDTATGYNTSKNRPSKLLTWRLQRPLGIRHLQIIINGISHSICMWFLSSALVALLAFSRLSFATSSSGDSVLVLLDASLEKENYSIFFGGLESMC